MKADDVPVIVGRAVAGGLLVAALALAGCASHGTSPLDPPVPVHGVLRMTGGPAGAPAPAVPGRVAFVGPGGRGSTMDVPTRPDGTFSLELNPGTYVVTGRSPLYGGGAGVCRTDHPLVVKAGSDPLVTVACDRK